MTTVRIDGLQALQSALKELPKATGKNAAKRALLKAAKPIDDDASARAPHLSGKLQTSVITGQKLTRSQRSGGPTLQADGSFRSASKNYVEVHVGTALSRGMFMEFGTFKDAPEPFLGPAWEAGKTGALETIKTALATETDKAAARLAKKRAKG